MNITGIMIYYYFVCQRKLWYFINKINMEQNSELVEIGKIIDETTYTKEHKNILIDNTINVDFIENGAILHEVKKTKAIEEAGIWQIKYYMYYLKKKNVNVLKAEIDFPLLREKKEVKLEDDDIQILENVIKNINDIANLSKPPNVVDEKFCKKCAYFDLCYI